MPRTTVRLDRRSLLAGLGAAGLASPAAGAGADAGLLAIERRTAELASLREAARAERAAAEARYLGRRRERPVFTPRPPRDIAEIAAARRAAASAPRVADWAAADAALLRETGCDTHRAALAALDREVAALVQAALALPATTTAGLAAKARLARRTGDDRLARSIVDDLLRGSEPVNAV